MAVPSNMNILGLGDELVFHNLGVNFFLKIEITNFRDTIQINVHTKLQLAAECLMSAIYGFIHLLGTTPKYSQISKFFNEIDEVAFH